MATSQTLELATKPGARIHYQYHKSSSPVLLVFLNGLGLPQAGWASVIEDITKLRNGDSLPNILTYDRYGQGQTTDRDPEDANAIDPTHGHDCMAVVRDLRQLLTQIVGEHMNTDKLDAVPLVFVANSIGCALARLYTQTYPGTVAGLLLLDSVLANSDFISVFPDPETEGFDASTLPEGITVESLKTSRTIVNSIFHPSVGSKEGLSRKNLAELLPASDGPALKGPDGRGSFVTVVGHDFDTFAEQSTRMGIPKVVTSTYANPYWEKYNQGLVRITEQDRSKGPLQAPNAGHFVQKDNPDFVVKELNELLSKVI